jgi:hypothetical protein
MNRKRIAGIRVCCVSLMVNTTCMGVRKIERMLPLLASKTPSPVPPLLAV